jgi:hypothetical protein
VRSQGIQHFALRRHLALWLGLVILTVSSQAQAAPFSRLQVLLPGETAAPGTGTGKSGNPDAQTVGVPFTVVIRAVDDSWNLKPEISDAVGWGSSDLSANLPAVAQLANGQMAMSVTLNAAGSFTISGQDLSDQTIDIAYSDQVVAVVLAGFQFAQITQKHHTAGDPFTIGITAIDPNGNQVGGYSGPVNLQQFTSFGLGRVSPETVTLEAGTWSGEVTMYRADETNVNRGNVNVYAFLPGDISINGSSNPFLVHPGNLKRIQIVLPGQSPEPGSEAGISGSPATQGALQDFTVDLYSTDDYWNQVNSNDVVRIVSTDTGANTPVTSTLSGGYAQATVRLSTVGSQTLTVNDLSNGTVRAMTTAGIYVIPNFAHHFEFDQMPESAVAGVATLITIRATDAAGNTIPDFDGDVNLAANTGPGSISVESAVFTNGTWTGAVKFYGAGAAIQMSCSDYATPPHVGTSGNLLVTPGPFVRTQVVLPGQTAMGGTTTGLSGEADDVNAGETFSVQVRAVDEYYNRVAGIYDPIIFDSLDTNISVPNGVALINGEAFVPITIYLAGAQTLSVSDATSLSIQSPPSSSFTVIPGPYTKLLLLAPGQSGEPGSESGRAGDATDQSITYEFSLTAISTDQWFNQVKGISDIVHLTCTDDAAELSEDLALVDGSAQLTARLATGGFQQLTLSSISMPSATLSTTQVRAISSGLHFEAQIAESVVQAGVPFTLSVNMVNDAGSIIQEINSEVEIAVRNANTQEPGRGVLSATSFQLLQGQRSVTLHYTYAEPIIIEVSDSAGSSPALTAALTVEPGAPTTLNVGSSPGWVRANRTAVINARITDAYGNSIPDLSVTFATTEADSGRLGDKPTKSATSVVSLTNADGVAAVNYHSPRHAQSIMVTASSGSLTAEYAMETALVDPAAAGGQITSYPNPFHPDETTATIAYVLDDNASVRVRVYTISGGLVLDQQYTSGGLGGSTGLNEIEWDGRNGDGEPVASGGYIVYVEAEGSGATQHVMRRKIGVVW